MKRSLQVHARLLFDATGCKVRLEIVSKRYCLIENMAFMHSGMVRQLHDGICLLQAYFIRVQIHLFKMATCQELLIHLLINCQWTCAWTCQQQKHGHLCEEVPGEIYWCLANGVGRDKVLGRPHMLQRGWVALADAASAQVPLHATCGLQHAQACTC